MKQRDTQITLFTEVYKCESIQKWNYKIAGQLYTLSRIPTEWVRPALSHPPRHSGLTDAYKVFFGVMAAGLYQVAHFLNLLLNTTNCFYCLNLMKPFLLPKPNQAASEDKDKEMKQDGDKASKEPTNCHRWRTPLLWCLEYYYLFLVLWFRFCLWNARKMPMSTSKHGFTASLYHSVTVVSHNWEIRVYHCTLPSL